MGLPVRLHRTPTRQNRSDIARLVPAWGKCPIGGVKDLFALRTVWAYNFLTVGGEHPVWISIKTGNLGAIQSIMKIVNDSGMPDEVLRLITKYLQRHCPEGFRACRVIVLDEHPYDTFSTDQNLVSGDAVYYNGWKLGWDEKHLVRIVVPRTTYTKSYPECLVYHGVETTLYSWDEEVAYTLAHELCHIEQYQRKGFNFHLADKHKLEEEAESFAKNVLYRYRKWRNRYLVGKLKEYDDEALAG